MQRRSSTTLLALILLFSAMTTSGRAQTVRAVALSSQSSERSSLLERQISLRVEDVTVATALMKLHEASGVPISFSPTLLPQDSRVSCACGGVRLGTALNRLLSGTGFDHLEMGGQIVIVKKPSPWPVTELAMNGSAGFASAHHRGVRSPALRGLIQPRRLLQGTVTGRVVAAQNRQPLSSVQISVDGTDIGMLTDENGQYSLPQVPAGTRTIRAQRIGYRTTTREVNVTAGGTVEANFELAETALGLDEIVASVSATDARRVELGTDFERFNADQVLRNTVVSDFSDLMKSRMTGVSITESSGEAGTGSQIRVRGATSLTQDNNPIMYVDGVRVSNQTGTGVGALGSTSGNGPTISRLDDINPADITNIQVLKGPTAAALYGSEAAAGVILIETKQGESGQQEFTFSTEQRFSNDVTAYPDNYYNLTSNAGITDPNDPRVAAWRPVQNPVTGEVFARDNPLENAHTNPFRTGPSSKYDVSLGGGQEGLRYFTSMTYEDQDGVTRNNELERWSVRANIDTRPTDRVDISVNSNFISSNVRFNGTGRSPQSILTNAMAGLPLFSFGTLPDGGRGECLATVLFNESDSICELQQGNLRANFEKIEAVRNEQEVGRFIGSVTTRFRPTEWFSNRFVAGIDHIQTRNYNLIPLDPQLPFRSLSTGTVQDQRATEQILTVEYAGTIAAQLSSSLSTSSTFGAQYFGSRSDNVLCTGEGGFASPTAIACNAALSFTGASNLTELVEIGAYFQQHVEFGRYLFATGAIRVDDNSAFGEQQGAIWSPSANVSAVISEMPFWNIDAMNSLRLRFAWGMAAQAPAPFAAARTYVPVRLDQNGQQVTGISPESPGNPELTAERNEEFEFGLDGAFMDDRISLSVTYFTQETRDAIVSTRVSPGTGFGGAKFVNIGAIANEGVEGTLTARAIESQDVALDLSLKLSTSDPIVTSLGGLPPILMGAQVNGMFHEGYAPGAYYGPVVEHAERDENGNIIPESVVFAPGNLNIPGRPDYRYMGRPTPSNEESLTASLTLFGRLHLFTLFHRAAGFSKMNDTEGTRTPFTQDVSGSRMFAFRQAELTPELQAAIENDIADAPQAFVDKADFIKWRELTLRYDLPPSVTRSLSGFIDAASITVGGRNLYTWTDYFGFDPEVRLGGGSDDFTSGEFFTMPAPRSFFVRLSTTF